MNFNFSVNQICEDEITRFSGQEIIRCPPELEEIVNKVGEASRVAQGLQKPVTTVPSFYGSSQTLYLMKDAQSNRGLGSIIGLLKVGPKKLFLLDKQGKQNETTPLCVLDFYIHESRQRMGIGKQLYEFFLQTEKVQPVALAIDRPSMKFLGFLRKHYKLVHTIPQVNNFVIYDGFFATCAKDSPSRRFATNRLSSHEPSTITAWPRQSFQSNLRHASSMKSVFSSDSPFTATPVSPTPIAQPRSPVKKLSIRVEESDFTAPTPFSSPSKTVPVTQPTLPSLSSQNKWASMAVLPSLHTQTEKFNPLASPTRKMYGHQTSVNFRLWETEDRSPEESRNHWSKGKESLWKATSVMDVNENSQYCLNRELPKTNEIQSAPQLKHHHHHSLW